jgi:hypothetical protein
MKKLIAVGIAFLALSLGAAGALAATTSVQEATTPAAADETAQANQGGDQGTANQGGDQGTANQGGDQGTANQSGDQGQKGEDGQSGEHGDAPGAATKK